MSDHSSNSASFILGRQGMARPQMSNIEGMRYLDQHVVFHREFTLGASADVYPPGDYIIETAETRHSAGGRTAHIHKSTMLIVPTLSGTRAIPVNVRELEVAMKKDVEHQQTEEPGGNRDTGGAETAPTRSVPSELERYGIERVPADVFIWGGYRYSNASDAIAAAKLAEQR